MRVLKCFVACYFVFIAVNSFSQDSSPYEAVIPPSPEAASLTKFIDFPVNQYTGIPSIQIPIHEMKSYDISVPIGLSYHAGGIKVEEIASRVGLGWALNAGGMITRAVMGTPDEYDGGYLNNDYTYESILESPVDEMKDVFDRVNEGEIDLQPDEFYFNFLNFSGKFYLDKANPLAGVITVPYTDLTFSYTISGSGQGAHVQSFVIRDNLGFQYYFGQSSDGTRLGHELTKSIQGRNRPSGGVAPVYSTWFLMDIVSPLGNSVLFYYDETYTTSVCQKNTETKYQLNANNSSCEAIPTSKFWSTNTTYGRRLTKITDSVNSVVFSYGDQDRLDFTGDRALKFISVNSRINNEVKKIELETNYFTSTGGLSADYCDANNDASRTKRLRLDKILQHGGTDTITLYQFTYKGKLPERLSNAQDHWGYFNHYANSGMVPAINYSMSLPGGGITTYTIPGANRNPNESATSSMLETIKHPTGGETRFEFENNEAFVPNFDFEVVTEEDDSLYAFVETSDETHIRRFYQNFTVNGAGGSLDLKFYLTGGDCDLGSRDPNTGCGVDVRFENLDTNERLPYPGGVADGRPKTYTVPNGNYQLAIIIQDVQNENAYNFGASIWGPKSDVANNKPYNKKVGGVRVKRITYKESPTSGDIIWNYEYKKTENSSQSSGLLHSTPRYDYQYRKNVVLRDQQTTVFTCSYRAISANSMAPLMTASGAVVGYENVQVSIGANGEGGKTDFTFSNYSVPFTTQSFPFAPYPINEWRKGLLLGRKDYQKQTDSYQLVKSENNEYVFLDEETDFGKRRITGIKTGCQTGGESGCEEGIFQDYEIETEWFYKSNVTEKIFDIKNASIETNTSFFYEAIPNHIFLTKLKSTDSKGGLNETSYKYVPDVVSWNSEAINQMLTKGMRNRVVLESSGNEKGILSANLTEYQIFLSGAIQPGKLYSLRTATPLPVMPAVNYGNAVNHNFTLELESLQFDAKGNILEYKGRDGIVNSFIWGYDSQLPIAKVINSSRNVLFYSGFEEAGTPESLPTEPAQAGVRYLNSGSFNFSSNGFEPSVSTNLRMSYWYWNNNQWNYSGIVNWSNTISNGTRLDEIRVFPLDAQMSTYTHDPLIGITSITDANAVTIFYDYDSYGRLQVVKDSKKNVLKTIGYHYKNSENESDMNYIRSTSVNVAGKISVPEVESASINEATTSIGFFDGLGRPVQSVNVKGSPMSKDLVQPVVYDILGRESRKYLPFAFGTSGWYKEVAYDGSGNYSTVDGVAASNYSNNSTGKIAQDSRPFSETVFEGSPLNRPLKDYGAGSAWGPETGGSDKFMEHQYLVNVHGDEMGTAKEKVLALEVDASGSLKASGFLEGHIEVGGYYSSGQLNIKVTLDEHGSAVREYTNKSGQVILKKVQVVAGSTNLNSLLDWACTYYVYDDFGNLRAVLPPEAVVKFVQP